MNRFLPRALRQSGVRGMVPLALAGAQLGAILWVGRTGGFSALAERLGRSDPALPSATSLQQWRAAVASDPGHGFHLPHVVLADNLGGRLAIGTSHRPGGLFFISACTECVASSVGIWDKLQRAHSEADLRVLPASVDPERIDQYRRWHHLGVRFVTRGGQELYRRCNAYFLPRVYVFDRRGCLVYVQPPSVATDAALAAAGRTLRAITRATSEVGRTAAGRGSAE